MLPYKDISPELREFTEEVSELELKWHRDLEDRTVSAAEPTDWQLQLEDELPRSLTAPITITAGTWHRVIKGTGNLVVKIIKDHE
jgi:hypothetical protein